MTILNDDNSIREILSQIRRVAVVGAKADGGPAQEIPHYLAEHGYDVVPVNPKGEIVAGIASVTSLKDAGDVDAVVFFRRAEALPGHREELLHAAPKLAWLQLGIHNEDEAGIWSQAGMKVVQNRCIMVEHRRLFA